MPLFGRKRDDESGDASAGPPSPLRADGRLRVQCWYCEQEIDYEGFDPCAVILVSNWADEGQQREQQFFAHAECFRKSGSGNDLYVFQPGFSND